MPKVGFCNFMTPIKVPFHVGISSVKVQQKFMKGKKMIVHYHIMYQMQLYVELSII